MQTYILKRLLLAIPMLFGISFVTFIVMQMAPGEAGGGKAGEGTQSTKLTPQQRTIMERTFHLDERLDKRYYYWLGLMQNPPSAEDLSAAERKALNKRLFNTEVYDREPTPEEKASITLSKSEIKKYIPKTGILYGDFGYSMAQHSKKVWDLLAEAIPVTLLFNLLTFILIYLFAIPLGVFSATHQNSRRDKVITVGLFMLYSMPSFWIALLLIKFVVLLPKSWQLPIHGIQPSDPNHMTFLEWIWASSRYFVLPLFVMTYGSFAYMSRYMRSGMIDTIRSDYIRTARSKGLSEFWVVYKHALRNSLIPIITLLGSEIPALFGGSVIIESIFGIPGMGRLAYQALNDADYTVLMADLTLIAVMVMIGFLVSDILYKVADPRISFDGDKG